MSGRYIEIDGKPVLEPDLLKWGAWMGKAERTVEKTVIDGVMISTVFLGLDYNFRDYGELLIYETMAFGGPLDEIQRRYSTREFAERGHWRVVTEVEKSMLIFPQKSILECDGGAGPD